MVVVPGGDEELVLVLEALDEGGEEVGLEGGAHRHPDLLDLLLGAFADIVFTRSEVDKGYHDGQGSRRGLPWPGPTARGVLSLVGATFMNACTSAG